MSASLKWLALGTDILIYEIAHADDGELLSEACDRLIERHPIAARFCIVCAGALLTVHLANLIDPEFDVVSHRFWRRNLPRIKRAGAVTRLTALLQRHRIKNDPLDQNNRVSHG